MKDYGGVTVSDRIGYKLKASKQDEEVTLDLLLVIKKLPFRNCVPSE